MSLINICEEKSSMGPDIFARYKRNQVEINYKKNKTIITNLKIISTQLHVPFKSLEQYITKKITNQLGTRNCGNLTFAGQFTVLQVENILRIFIKKHILCEKCGLPELNLENVCQSCGQAKISKKQTIMKSSTDNEPSKYPHPAQVEFSNELKKIYKYYDQFKRSNDSWAQTKVQELTHLMDQAWQCTCYPENTINPLEDCPTMCLHYHKLVKFNQQIKHLLEDRTV